CPVDYSFSCYPKLSNFIPNFCELNYNQFAIAERPMDFATFLEIAKEEHNSGDELTEIIKALRGLDRDGTRSIPAKELRSILASIGERMSHQEIDNFLKQVAVGGMVPHQKLIEYISKRT
ncbi:unnamed protein product, partial [Strongylus vulgaris]